MQGSCVKTDTNIIQKPPCIHSRGLLENANAISSLEIHGNTNI